MDACRFAACFLVVLNHAVDLTLVDFDQVAKARWLVAPLYFMSGLGNEAVMIFFVLSGFWITKIR